MSENEMMNEWEEELALEGQTRDGFIVTDDSGAAWCVKKIREAEAECQKMLDWYQSQIDKALAKRDATIERMRAYLMDYAETVPMKETKTQFSYAIPGGKMVRKKAGTKYEHDDAVLLKALKESGRDEYIKTVTTEKVAWKELKKELEETGELLDGVTVVEVPEEFVVQLDS